MDGKAYFQDYCDQIGLKCKTLFQLGAQTSRRVDRLEFRCSPYMRKETQIFAVCYFKTENVYAAWSLKEPKAKMKSVFSVSRYELASLSQYQILKARKSVEYSGWNEETVYLFTPESVPTFIELYCGGELCL